MAKRKRLKPAAFTRFEPKSKEAPVETKAEYPMGVAPGAVTRAPIAQVAGDTATYAALEELVDEVDAARSGGRLVVDVALDDIEADHLIRDRTMSDPEEMAALKASLVARGQQTPIEVIELETGGYGLISGWRRLTALQALKAESSEAQFDTIQALIKPLKGAADSYLAMVEENEIRAGLSFYERARLAAEASRLGIYPTPARAVQSLFAHAPAAKRSKITAFLRIHDRLGKVLQFPEALSEKTGLAISKALAGQDGFEARAKAALRHAKSNTPTDERAVLERALKRDGVVAAASAKAELVKGISFDARKGRILVSGKGVDAALTKALKEWILRR